MFGFTVYNGPFQNFLRDEFHCSPTGLGGLESVREIPGLLAALTTGMLLMHAESRLAALGLAVAGAGIAATAAAHTFGSLIGITVGWSIGFHLYVSVSNAITLGVAKGVDGGRRLGQLSGVGAVATMGALGLSYLAFRTHVPYAVCFLAGGLCIIAAGWLCYGLHYEAPPKDNPARIVLRKEYGLFYLLTFLEGCRRQIFSIFASFALILHYHLGVEQMLLIQLVNSVMITATAPRIGKLVDRVGERGPLTFYAIGLIVVFLGYATSSSAASLVGLFLIDNVLFSFSVGFTTYLNRIVRPGELTPCLAMGVTMNHVAAVTVPYFGALLWQRMDNYQAPFWVGTGIAVLSLFVTRMLPKGAATV